MVPSDSSYAHDPEAAVNEAGRVLFQRDLLPPREQQRQISVWLKAGSETGIEPGPVSISFTDAAGRRWKRYPDGRLVELNRPRRSRKDY